MHRFLSRSDESDGLSALRHARQRPPQAYSLSTLRRPTECNTDRTDDFVAAVENLCIVRARTPERLEERFEAHHDSFPEDTTVAWQVRGSHTERKKESEK